MNMIEVAELPSNFLVELLRQLDGPDLFKHVSKDERAFAEVGSTLNCEDNPESRGNSGCKLARDLMHD